MQKLESKNTIRRYYKELINGPPRKNFKLTLNFSNILGKNTQVDVFLCNQNDF